MRKSRTILQNTDGHSPVPTRKWTVPWFSPRVDRLTLLRVLQYPFLVAR